MEHQQIGHTEIDKDGLVVDYRCPNCKKAETFHVSALASPYIQIGPNADCLDYDIGDIEWDRHHFMKCDACDHEGEVSDFEV